MIGQVVSHYRVLDQIGGGGMGVVYRAQDLRLGRNVALKFLPPELSRVPASLERFRREAETISSLNHPHICTLYDIGELEGRQFLVLELVEGRALKDAIGAGPLPVPQAVRLAIEVADALDAAHARGIVHRDVKPGNVLVTERGDAKLLDFGIATLEAGADCTGAGAVSRHAGVCARGEPELETGTLIDASRRPRMDERALFTKFWENESKTTRNVIARIPEGSDYRPDRKSRTASEIAWQIACEEKMIIEALETGKAEWAPPPAPATMKELLDIYEQQSADIVRRWKALPAARWDGTLECFGGQRPASPMAWSFLFDIVHHRGQITTYLRPMGSTVPQIYGPSGDEP